MKVYDHIPDNLRNWALQQPLFFTASAPLTGHHVNCSPKGLPNASFAVFDSHSCAYIDSSGSGNETISHIYEKGNGRVTIMFCSFDRLPRIMRWYCKGSVVEWWDGRWEETLRRMGKSKAMPGARAIVLLEVWKVTTSCGTGVPIIGQVQTLEEEMENDDGAQDRKPITTTAREVMKDRHSMDHWCEFMEERGKMKDYWKNSNAASLDGLSGLKGARKMQGQWMLVEDLRLWIRRIFAQWEAILVGMLIAFTFVVALRSVGLVLV